MFAGVFAKTSIVGYQTVEGIQKGQFVALAIQFENVAGGEIAIKDLLTVATPAGGNSLGTGSDQIWLWDTEESEWVKYFHRIYRDVDYGWCEEGKKDETNATVSSGATVFFYRGGSATTSITLAGAVKAATGESTVTLAKGQFAFMAYPWPIALTINDFTKYQTTPAGGNSLGTGSDQIWLWDTEESEWVKYFHRIYRDVDYGWCEEGKKDATSATIPAGKGFFFYRGGSATDTITLPAPTGL